MAEAQAADASCGVVAGSKRPAYDQPGILDGVKAVLIDVEGTSLPLSFVKEVLLPYAKDYFKTYLEKNFNNEEVTKCIDAIRLQDSVDIPPNDQKEAVVAMVADHVSSVLNSSSKTSAVQHILAEFWHEMLKTDSIQGEVYDDVVPVLRLIVSSGIKVYSYSTEFNIQMQRLLFTYSNHGKIIDLFSGHFDKTHGCTATTESCIKVAQDMGLQLEEVLFLTHLPKEADVVTKAGAKACVIVREGNPALSDEDFQYVVLFSLHDVVDSSDAEGALPAKRRHDDYGYDEYDDSGSDEGDGGHGDEEDGEDYGAHEGYHGASGGDENDESQDG